MDASSFQSMNGGAFLLNDHSKKFNLGTPSSIFTAELFAIFEAIQYSISLNDPHFAIFSDSLSCIQSISKLYSKNPLVQRIQELMSQSSKYYVFIWIPSHLGIDKNEKVD